MSNPVSKSRACLGIFERRERWSLSPRGWLVLFAGLLACVLLFLATIHPFLAVTRRVNAEDLVMEGWIHKYAVRAAAAEFKSGNYRRVFSTGGPIEGLGPLTNGAPTSAGVGARHLQEAGVPKEAITAVPSAVRDRDRTYSGAVALHLWLQENHPEIHKIDIITVGPHARRTRLLFQKALGKNVSVGIISVPNPDYPPNRWWRYSEGVREIISEGAAYLYARFLFHPDN